MDVSTFAFHSCFLIPRSWPSPTQISLLCASSRFALLVFASASHFSASANISVFRPRVHVCRLVSVSDLVIRFGCQSKSSLCARFRFSSFRLSFPLPLLRSVFVACFGFPFTFAIVRATRLMIVTCPVAHFSFQFPLPDILPPNRYIYVDTPLGYIQTISKCICLHR